MKCHAVFEQNISSILYGDGQFQNIFKKTIFCIAIQFKKSEFIPLDALIVKIHIVYAISS